MQFGKSKSEKPQIRIALVEDDENFQNALAAAIATAPDMEMACVASTRAQGLQMLNWARADVLLVDLGLPDGSGIDVIRAAQFYWPACGIMVSSTLGDEAHVMRSIEAGATGYLLKDSTPARMVDDIRNLHAGGSPINPLIARKILMQFRPPTLVDDSLVVPPDPGKPRVVLSERETEVLAYITKGFTSSEIADLLCVSFHTVQTYVRRIYAKLEVKSRAEAIYEARHLGLLPK